MSLHNRRMTDRPKDCPLQRALDLGAAHLRSNPGLPTGDSVAVVIAAMVRA